MPFAARSDCSIIIIIIIIIIIKVFINHSFRKQTFNNLHGKNMNKGKRKIHKENDKINISYY